MITDKILTYASWHEFIAATRKPSEMPDSARSSKDDSFARRGFNGCSLATAHKMADEGWLEGAERARKFATSITDALGGMIERVEVNYDIEGHSVDIGRYVDNEPECWQKFEVDLIQQPAVKLIRIVVNVSASGGVSTRVIERRGAVVAAMVELLEYAGNRCEVVMSETCTGGGVRLVTLATIKQFSEPLDMPKIAYALGHPSTLRVHHFSMMETELNAHERSALHVGSGYGMPADVPDEHRGDIYLPKMGSWEAQWDNEHSAVTWVLARLKEFGVHIHENTPTS